MEDKMIPVFRLTETHDGTLIYCRTMAQVTEMMGWFVDDGYLEPVNDEYDICWQFNIHAVMMPESELATLEPFER